uniref:Uncharacterized protein n=1 Tax=Globisporangium ultimum (strain ATCC 200006 / CBS 805.95 / DAOM BR144) TaxID=431595 RepID=K3X8R6_GLOUD
MSRASSQQTQNCDNFLREKPSTRLHQPPGGGSSVGSLIYGGGCDESPFAGHERRTSLHRRKDEAPEQLNPYTKDYRRGSGGGNDYYQQQPSGPYPGYQQPPQQQQQYGGPAVGSRERSSNSYANGSNQNAGNVLTDRRITRIHAPPGGTSSITFG